MKIIVFLKSIPLLLFYTCMPILVFILILINLGKPTSIIHFITLVCIDAILVEIGIVIISILFGICLGITHIVLPYKHIGGFLTYSTRTNKIEENMNLKTYFKLSLKNNYNKRQVNRRIIKNITENKNDLIKFFSNTNIKSFNTNTNSTMISQLEKIEKNGLITICECKYIGKFKQIPEKLFLMGFNTVIINLFNTEFWKYIFKNEEISYCKIILNNNQ